MADREATIASLRKKLDIAKAEAAAVLQTSEAARDAAKAEAERERLTLINQLRNATDKSERLQQRTSDLEGKLKTQKIALAQYKAQMKK